MDRRLKKRMDYYWEGERRKLLKEIDELEFAGWFDFWHTHPDSRYKGNRNADTRAMAGALTCLLLKEIQSRADQTNSDLQVWAHICESTGNNAVYVHSENPNSDNFPCDFKNTDWTVQPPTEIAGQLDLAEYEIGKMRHEEETVYVLRKRT